MRKKLIRLRNRHRKVKICETCGCDCERGHYGEKRGNEWRYYCDPCYKSNFCKMVNSNPVLKSKYYGIHGKSPEEVILN